jgi:hypothetical protein
MTVKKDLEKALAAAQSAKGTYAAFETSTEDKSAQQMFRSMSQDMDQHISQLNSRIGVTAQNQLNSSSDSSTSATATNQQENFQ